MPKDKISLINSEFLFDKDSVCVEISRYNELVSAEEKLKIMEALYLNNTSFLYYKEFLKLIFGPKGENEDVK